MLVKCEVCGFSYVKGSAADRNNHRKRHSKTLRVLQPQPSVRFLKRLAHVDDPEHVNVWSPKWIQQELFLRAQMFQREFRYDFPQWSPFEDEEPDAHGFVFNDDTGTFGDGAIVGGGVFRWREFEDASSRWTFDWVWIAPKVRHKGVLSRRWPAFLRRFSPFHLMRPLSPDMQRFAEKHHSN